MTNLALQTTLLLLLCLTLGFFLRRRGPIVAALTQRATLAALVVVVFTSLALPSQLPALWRVALSAPPPVQILPIQNLPVQMPTEAAAPIEAETKGAPKTTQKWTEIAAIPEKTKTLSAKKTNPAGKIALAIWAVGALLGVMKLVGAGLVLRRLARQAKPVIDREATATLTDLAEKMQVRAPSLAIHASVQSPFLVGVRRPKLFLPEAWNSEFDAATLHAIFVHELTHLRRRDPAWNALLQVISALLWPQVFLLVLRRQMARTSEELCDLAVLADSHCPPRRYADCLLRLAERANAPQFAVGVVPFRSALARRVALILSKETRPMKPVTARHRLLAAFGAACLIAVSLCLISVGKAQTPPVSPKATAHSVSKFPTLSRLQYQTLVMDAAARAGVTPTPQEIDKRQAQIGQATPRIVQNAEKNPQQKNKLRQDLAADIALENLQIKDIHVSPAEVSTFYATHKTSFRTPPAHGKPGVMPPLGNIYAEVERLARLVKAPSAKVTLQRLTQSAKHGDALQTDRPQSLLRLAGRFFLQNTPAQTPTPAQIQEKTDQNTVIANARQIGLALAIYVQDNGEKFPPASRWMDAIARYQKPTNIYGDPSAPNQKYAFPFNRALSGKSLAAVPKPAETVIAFSSTLNKRNASDTGQSLPRPGWHRGGSIYVFVDGHVKYFSDAARPSLAVEFLPAPKPRPASVRLHVKRQAAIDAAAEQLAPPDNDARLKQMQAELDKTKAELASARAELDRINHTDAGSDGTAATITFLSGELGKYKAKMVQAEDALISYKRTHLRELPEAQSNDIAQLSNLKSQLSSMDITADGARMRQAALVQEMAKINPAAQIGNLDKIIQELQARRQRLLASGKSPSHPRVNALTSQIAFLESHRNTLNANRKMTESERHRYNALGTQLKKAEISQKIQDGQMQILQAQIAELQARVDKAPSGGKQLIELQRNYGLYKATYNRMVAQRQDLMLKQKLEEQAKQKTTTPK